MIMKWRFTLVALLFCAVAVAQGSLEVKAEREEDNSVRIWADKTRAGKCTVVLKFRSLNNCANYGDGIYTVAGGSENLVRLKNRLFTTTLTAFFMAMWRPSPTPRLSIVCLLARRNRPVGAMSSIYMIAI